MKLDVYSYSNKGGRSYNEDSVGYLLDGNSGVFVVADGLGGHEFGELASETVCNTLLGDWAGGFNGNPVEWLNSKIELANQNILGLQQEKNIILKSTVVALTIECGRAVWANSGDSRLYFVCNNELVHVTNDHSVAYKMYKAGEITKNQIRTHEDQSSLLRSIGGLERYEPEIYDFGTIIKPGDAFMLCTDGVWEYISDEEVAIDLLKSYDSKQWAETLLLRLMDRIDGENDNLTILTIMVTE